MKTLPITKKLIGTADDYSFEERLYHGMLVFMMGFSLAYIIIVSILNKALMNTIFVAVTLLVMATLYYLARVKKRYFFFGFYLFSTLITALFYFINKGIYGTSPLVFLLVIVLALAYSPAKRHGIILLIHFIVLGLLFAIEYRSPQLVYDSFKTPQVLFVGLAICTLLCVFMLFLIINFLKKSYDNERKLNNQQKE
jgi:two-component system, sensor histidine kinase and response regulator